MAELPGWDRARLRYAPEPEVEGARWIVFARALAPAATEDWETHLQDARDAERPPSESARKGRLRRIMARIHEAIKQQKVIRAALLLDEEEEAAEGAASAA